MTAPLPLTPPDADLQDFPFMPLHVARLRDSDLASEVDPEACWYAVLLWAASWHQLPAGSLPDNDAVLTRLIGLGRDLRTFAKHKAGAMRGFVRCADGRLYHPVVAEQVVAAWSGKLQQRWRSECARIKKANQRNATNDPTPTYEQFLVSLPSGHHVLGDTYSCPERQTVVVPEDKGVMSPGCPPVSTVQEKETGTGTVIELEATASVGSAAPKPTKTEPWKSDPDFRRFWEGASPEARTRTSQSKTWGAFEKQAKAAGGRGPLADAFVRYMAEDRDVQRTGGPGLHTWLNDGRWEHWLPQSGEPSSMTDADWQTAIRLWRSDGTWLAKFGPRPGEPGCRAPSQLVMAEAPTAPAGAYA